MNWINIGVLEACNWIARNAIGRIFGLPLDRYCISVRLQLKYCRIVLACIGFRLECCRIAIALPLDCYRIAIDFIGLPLE